MRGVKGFVGIKSMKFSEIPSFFPSRRKKIKNVPPFEMHLGEKSDLLTLQKTCLKKTAASVSFKMKSPFLARKIPPRAS
jgi:hypothetical protein